MSIPRSGSINVSCIILNDTLNQANESNITTDNQESDDDMNESRSNVVFQNYNRQEDNGK